MAMDERAPVFVISVAAELSGMHPQTLRTYDRIGLVQPQRSAGRGRRYSARDIAQLREVQQLSQEEGINLAGIKRILDLQNRLRDAERELDDVRARIERLEAADAPRDRVFAATADGRAEALRRGERPRRGSAVVLWRRPPEFR